jgi:hypothetical protein
MMEIAIAERARAATKTGESGIYRRDAEYAEIFYSNSRSVSSVPQR